MKLTDMLTGITVKHSFTLSENSDWQNEKPIRSLEQRIADGTTKRLHGVFAFDGVELGMALDKATATARIAWQGPARKRWDDIADGDQVNIDVATAGRQPAVDPIEVLKARYTNAETDEERQALLDEIIGAGDES